MKADAARCWQEMPIINWRCGTLLWVHASSRGRTREESGKGAILVIVSIKICSSMLLCAYLHSGMWFRMQASDLKLCFYLSTHWRPWLICKLFYLQMQAVKWLDLIVILEWAGACYLFIYCSLAFFSNVKHRVVKNKRRRETGIFWGRVGGHSCWILWNILHV